MLRAGQLLPPKGLLTLRFSTGRFPPALAACYRASWQLPGPDFHRLADTSLRVDHLNVTTSWSSLCTHAAGHTKLGLAGSADVHPVQRALDRLLPACVTVRPLLLVPLGLPALGLVPVDL